LRTRGHDIELLARHFMRTIAADLNQPAKTLPLETIALLQRHSWFGNVRELKNVMERAFVICDGPELLPHHISLNRRTPAGEATPATDAAGTITIPREGMTLEALEREAILITLRAVDGNQSKAARILGVSRATLIRKLQKYELERTVQIQAVA
jgi:DNA-binding NtrC family response regulator